MDNNPSSEHPPKKPGLWKRFKGWLKRIWNKLLPARPVRKGTVWGITLMIVFMAVVSGLHILPGLPSVLNPLFGILFFLILGGLMWLAVFLGIKILSQVPRFINLAGVVSLIVLYLIFSEMGFPSMPALISTLMFGLGAAFLGGGLAALFNREFRYGRLLKKVFIRGGTPAHSVNLLQCLRYQVELLSEDSGLSRMALHEFINKIDHYSNGAVYAVLTVMAIVESRTSTSQALYKYYDREFL